MKKKVLFLCTGNSCRSQMAEGLLRHYFGKTYEAYSAGTAPTQVNPYATEVMAEIGIDISAQDSKHVNVLAGVDFDTAITVCDNAKESCPIALHSQTTINWSFYDPAEAEGNNEKKLEVFRKVRDQIKNSILEKFNAIEIVKAEESNLSAVKQMLKYNKLPYTDIGDSTTLYIAVNGQSQIGIVGIQTLGESSLLRSMVVSEEFRNQGYGRLLLELGIKKAKNLGVKTLYLMTETAAVFFKNNGFKAIDRESAPDCIKQTKQFNELCPCTASCMKRDL